MECWVCLVYSVVQACCFFIFCLDDISVEESEHCSPLPLLYCCHYLFSSVNICFISLSAPLLDASSSFLRFILFTFWGVVLGLFSVHRLSQVVVSRVYSSLWWIGFSLQWLLLFWSMGSRYMGFSSCGLWALDPRLSSYGSLA